jgi:hypothetical protein
MLPFCPLHILAQAFRQKLCKLRFRIFENLKIVVMRIIH